MRLKFVVGIFSLGCVLATPAQAKWQVTQSEHFEMYSQEKEKDVIDFVAKLERFNMILQFFSGAGNERPGKRLKVYWVRNANQVQEIVRAVGSGIQGYYVSATPYGSISVVPGETKSRGSRHAGSSDQDGIDPETVIFHEYGHHFMLQNFPVAFPGWFVEGFAEYYGNTKLLDDGKIVLGSYAETRTAEINYFGVASLEKLLDPKARGRLGSFYGSSWLLTHYLNFNPERRAELNGYLADVQSGVDSVEAANKNFKGGISQLQKEVGQYWKRRVFNVQTLGNVKDYDRSKIKTLALPDDEASVMMHNIRFLSGFADDKNERAKLRSALQDAVKANPQSAYMKAFLADVYGVNDEDDLAIATASEALAIDPSSQRARLVKAVALMEKAQTMEGANTKRKELTPVDLKAKSREVSDVIVVTANRNAASAPHWAEALKLITAANRADSEDPYPLYLYYEYLRRRGEAISDVAIDGLTKAHVTSPQYSPFRFALAAAFSADGDNRAAASLVKAEAFSPHGGDDRRLAKALLKRYECLQADPNAACDFKILSDEEEQAQAEKDSPKGAAQ
jgi:hypothetical protein